MATKGVDIEYHDYMTSETGRDEDYRGMSVDQGNTQDRTEKLFNPPGGRQSPSGRFLENENEKISPAGEPDVRDAVFEQQSSQRPGRIQRYWAHVKRHWILYSIGNLIFTIIMLIIFFFAILPAVVQGIVNSNDLPVISSALTNPTPDHIDVSLTSELKKIPGGLSADMDAQTLGLYLTKDDRSPFLEIDLPAYHLKGKTSVVVTNQTRPVLDQQKFGEFLRNSLNSRNFTMYIKSKTTIHLTSILKYKVHINKGVRVPGLNQLQGFGVDSLAYTDSGLVTNVILPNPSPFELEIGNLTQNLYSGTNKIGTGVINNVVLYRYSNTTYPLISNIDTSAALQNLTGIISSQAPAIASGKLTLTSTANATVYHGQEIPYWLASMSGLRLTTNLDLQKVLGVLESTNSSALTSALNGTALGGLVNGSSGSSLSDTLQGILSKLNATDSPVNSFFQGVLQGIQEEAGANMPSILSGLLGGGSRTSTRSTKKVENADVPLLMDDTILTDGLEFEARKS